MAAPLQGLRLATRSSESSVRLFRARPIGRWRRISTTRSLRSSIKDDDFQEDDFGRNKSTSSSQPGTKSYEELMAEEGPREARRRRIEERNKLLIKAMPYRYAAGKLKLETALEDEEDGERGMTPAERAEWIERERRLEASLMRDDDDDDDGEEYNENEDGEEEDEEENLVDEVLRTDLEDSFQGKPLNSFLNMGEEEPVEYEGMEDDEDLPDVSSIAHGELQHHREMRHYARLISWDMPLLSQFAKPFEPPSRDMVLRYRYTSYMGEVHPAEKKVVLEFCPGDMPGLTPLQQEKLKKLAGVRYNPATDIIKMSSEMYESPAQNKRYLGDLVDSLVKEATDTTDTFEDVPLDLRHHIVKPKPVFPREWLLTARRKKELAEIRAKVADIDRQKYVNGQVVDGLRLIEDAVKNVAQAIPEMVSAGGNGQRGSQVSVRRTLQ